MQATTGALQEGDTPSTVADSVGASVERVTSGVADTGRLIRTGEWDAVCVTPTAEGAKAHRETPTRIVSGDGG